MYIYIYCEYYPLNVDFRGSLNTPMQCDTLCFAAKSVSSRPPFCGKRRAAVKGIMAMERGDMLNGRNGHEDLLDWENVGTFTLIKNPNQQNNKIKITARS